MTPEPAWFLATGDLGPLLVVGLRFVQRRTAVKPFGSGARALRARLASQKALYADPGKASA